MTAYDPSLIPPRGNLLQRLGFGRARPVELEQEPAALAQRSMAEDAIGNAVERIARFLKDHRLDVTPLTLNAAHAYVSGHDHQLRHEIDTRMDRLEPITLGWLRSLAEANVDSNADQFDKVFDLLEKNITSFSDTTQTAQRATREYGAVLESHAAELKRGDPGERQLVQVATVVAAMVQRTRKLEEQLLESQKQAGALRDDLEDVQRKANLDHLTGLPNRRAFDRMFDEEIRAAQAEIEPLCVAFCDIDHFKKVNDTHGHEAGDRVLKAIARKLASITDDRCHVARHGGEEFVMLFRGLTVSQTVARLDAVREEMAARRLVNRKNDEPIGHATFSAGVADVFDYPSQREALGAADDALYAAKSGGRNQIVAAKR
jgi:diguanylate cyclase